MKDGVDTTDWSRYAQPLRNAPGEVPAALRALADPSDLNPNHAYHRVLNALGNNHAGTYFPVAVPAIIALGEILREGTLLARLRALNTLIDLVGSFWPDPDFEEVETMQGRRRLKEVVFETAKGLRGDVEHRRRTPEIDEEAKLAEELLEVLDE